MAKNSKIIEDVALQRMNRLMELAEHEANKLKKDSDVLALRYVKMAMRISSHYKIKMPLMLKRRICRGCSSILIPGRTCTARISEKQMIYKCRCGKENRLFPTLRQVSR